MRTSVMTNPDDTDETDEYPGCAGRLLPESGVLCILDAESGMQATYGPGEWVAFETYAD